MIRMGRSNKTDQLPETPVQETFTPNPTTGGMYASRQEAPSMNRAMSESESMARDIKEGRLSGFVGNGTVLTGETGFQAMLRVDGHLTGKVGSESGTLVVGSTGRVDADIMVAAAMINGTVNGDITASEKVELGRTARVIGNIQTPRLVIDEGALFEGNCSMLKSKDALDKKSFDNKAKLETSDLLSLEETLEGGDKAESASV